MITIRPDTDYNEFTPPMWNLESNPAACLLFSWIYILKEKIFDKGTSC